MLPEPYKDEKLLSKGFHTALKIQNFPIRNKASLTFSSNSIIRCSLDFAMLIGI